MKVVINTTYGGFSLSREITNRYEELKGVPAESCYFLDREDPALIQAVEELSGNAEDSRPNLKVVEIPDGVEYEIAEYDGLEWIAEKHRTWS